ASRLLCCTGGVGATTAAPRSTFAGVGSGTVCTAAAIVFTVGVAAGDFAAGGAGGVSLPPSGRVDKVLLFRRITTMGATAIVCFLSIGPLLRQTRGMPLYLLS